MDNSRSGKPDWQVALEHHEELCAERYKGIDKRFDAVDQRFDAVDQRFEAVDKRLDNIEKLQRVTLVLIFGGFFAMPAIIVALLKFFF